MRQVLARVDATLTDLAGLGEMSLGDSDVVRVLDALTSASSRLARELCRVAAEATAEGSETPQARGTPTSGGPHAAGTPTPTRRG
ncbi:hypothetical protein NOCD_18395 [Nocardioides cavernae]|uniref:hypothetical protein n=1 Tax=Nocardioides cavernae TaxID=1921566 RepID=UPI00200CE30D|nr:hypothetical protein [Nocardioides cavernae]MCK9825457.1 hypothetical protein [Nocardioides cavernae]